MSVCTLDGGVSSAGSHDRIDNNSDRHVLACVQVMEESERE